MSNAEGADIKPKTEGGDDVIAIKVKDQQGGEVSSGSELHGCLACIAAFPGLTSQGVLLKLAFSMIFRWSFGSNAPRNFQGSWMRSVTKRHGIVLRCASSLTATGLRQTAHLKKSGWKTAM